MGRDHPVGVDRRDSGDPPMRRALFVAALVVVTVATVPGAERADAATPCQQWRATALHAGWTAQQWPAVARIMWRESRCQPGARNPSGAAGLMQLMPMHWRGRNPYNPATNLTIAHQLYRRAGWRPWRT